RNSLSKTWAGNAISFLFERPSSLISSKDRYHQNRLMNRTRFISGLITLSCVMAGLTVTDHVLAQTSPAQKQFELTILHVNDHHSHLDDKPRTLLLKNASGSPQEVKVSAGGFPR